MLSLLMDGQIGVVVMLIGTIVFSLTLHEFGHAYSAKLLGDNTAEQAGRLTINPVAHIDPLGLLMVVLIGFGYAKPVPFNPRNTRVPWASAAIGAAGPFANLLIAIVSINIYVWAGKSGAFDLNGGLGVVLVMLAQINLLLMIFNLIPLGPLDGHYIMSWLLPKHISFQYDRFNYRYGNYLFIGLILLSIVGVPIFRFVMNFASILLPYLIVF